MNAPDTECICEWEGGCGGTGIIHCAGCGGDFCICAACSGQGWVECGECEDCDYDEREDDLGYETEDIEDMGWGPCPENWP